MRVPPHPPRRRSLTRATYYRQGRRALERALKLQPDRETGRFSASAAIEAVVRATELAGPDGDLLLRATTCRRYLAEHRVLVAVLVRYARRRGEACEEAPAMARIKAALDARRGRPAEARATSRRVRDATQEEVEAVVGHLKSHALRHRRVIPGIVALYAIIVPRIGCRPVELCGAYVNEGSVYLASAKRADGSHRRLDLKDWPPLLVEAVSVLAAVAPAPGDNVAFRRWTSRLASALAQACRRLKIRRLCLYSFRHVAIATWEKLGYSAADIAALAGHLSIDTARLHYARSINGWTLTHLPQPPRSELSCDERPALVPNAGYDVVDDFPAPPAPRATQVERALWQTWSQRQEAELDLLDSELSRLKAARDGLSPNSSAIGDAEPRASPPFW